MGNCNRESRVRAKHPFTDVRAKIPYDCICLLKFCNINITKSYLFPHILLGVNSNYMTGKDWTIFLLIPVPLTCKASALAFELIPLAEVPPLH